MRSIVGRLSMLAMACVLSGCYAPPESMVALSEPGADYDHRLIGTWNSVDEDGKEAIYLEIRPDERREILDIVGIATFARPEAPNPVYWLRATAYASQIDTHTYYNVQRVAGSGFDYTAEGEHPGFIVLQATFLDEAALNLCPMRIYGAKNNVKDKRLSGRVVEGRFAVQDEYAKYTVLDLSREELVASIRDLPPEELFDCFPPFHKVSITNSEVWPK